MKKGSKCPIRCHDLKDWKLSEGEIITFSKGEKRLEIHPPFLKSSEVMQG